MTAPPRIDARGAAEVARQLESLIGQYAPEWREIDPTTGRATGFSAALVGVFARFAELTIQRLNAVPGKNQLAFLDLLGAAPLPPQPARAPLTFGLAAGATGALVPARTPVAAAPPDGSRQPLLFETETALAVTPARLARIVSWDAHADRQADQDAVAEAENSEPAILFQGRASATHAFHIAADSLLGTPNIHSLEVTVTIATPPEPFTDPRVVQWEMLDGPDGSPIGIYLGEGPHGDGTLNLTQSGTVVFNSLRRWPRTVLGGQAGHWLRARLLTPVTTSAEPVPGFVRASQLPRIEGCTLFAHIESDTGPPDHAFSGSQPLDVSRDFFPFGERPAAGAAWYIASDTVFSRVDSMIRIRISPTPTGPGLTVGGASNDLRIRWEYWDGGSWVALGDSTPGAFAAAANTAFVDSSYAFTSGGEIAFVLPTPSVPVRVGGVEAHWVRARIVSGWFDTRSLPNRVGPSLATVAVTYDNGHRGPFRQLPDRIVISNGMQTAPVSGGFTAFQPAADTGRSVYLGFSLPPGLAALAQTPISLFAELAAIPFGTAPDTPDPGPAPQLAWSYWGSRGWSGLGMEDGTEGLTVSGPLRFLPPRDLVATVLFGDAPLLWIRAAWTQGDYKFLPRLRRLLLNTVPAEQAVTVMGEVLGSGTGEASLRLKAALAPILPGIQLEVIESELPSGEERLRIIAAEGEAAIAPQPGGGVRVRWHAVADFHSSGPRDRHFLVDHQSGALLFGDGVNGMIPPRGAGNIRAARYRTGGGRAGNVGPGAIAQLKTTVPYVDWVRNPIAASGGVEGETLDSLRQRAPRLLRHGSRAVTAEDFEDLARLASPEVARCLAVPLLDLTIDPDGRHPRPGTVTVVVVPRANASRPAPSVELVDRVLDQLRGSAQPGVEIVVTGPEYLRVDVQVEVGLVALDGAGAVSAAVQAALERFLHPLTGGRDGTGWAFGRQPHRSDITALLQAVPGVDHLRRLEIGLVPDRAGAETTRRFLLCSGLHAIDLVFGS